jgi:hypothetical protein
LWRIRRQSVRLIAEPTSARREQRLMTEAEVDRFSAERSDNQKPMWLISTN